jgi:hypothetical protein
MNRSLIAALLVASCVAIPTSGRISFEPGTIVAAGYIHRGPDSVRDTSTAIGSFVHRTSGLTIKYSAFTPGYVFADPADVARHGNTVIWTRTAGNGAAHRVSTLYEDSFQNRTFCVSFPAAGPTNFVVRQPTREQIAQTEQFVGTFIPKSSNDF